MKSEKPSNRQRVTLVELLCFAAIFGAVLAPAPSVFGFALLSWFVTVIACVGVLLLFGAYRGWITLLCLLFIAGGSSAFMFFANQYGGGVIVTCLAGSIGICLSYGVLYVIAALFFCPFPYRKKCELRTCHNHYYNWIQIEKDIWYRECYVCHQEYVLFCFKYETIVNADGTLSPYLKRTKWGWKTDHGTNPEMLAFVTPEVISQVRDRWKKERNSYEDA